ncbi:MAG: TetR/AcrR family transcriptional regulator [Ilumatobacteraceae bacterium]
MGYRHTKDDIRDGAIVAAFEDGLSRLTFGSVAKRLGISDRVVVYYFPTKDDLVTEVLFEVGSQLQAALAPVVAVPAGDHVELMRAVWPVLACADADAVFALFFEAIGLAAAGREPFATFVPQLVDGWIGWAAERLRGAPATRRSEAAAAIATVDGLLMIRQVAGAEVAERAARRLGVAGPSRSR